MARAPGTTAVLHPIYQRWLLPFATGATTALVLALWLCPRPDVLAASGPADMLERDYLVLQGDAALLRAEFAHLAARVAAERRDCPAPEPAPRPEAAIEPDESLRIPEEARRSGDLSFLAGCWTSITNLFNTRTREPIVVEYCFDAAGNGQSATIEQTQRCVAPTRARFDGEGRLQFQDLSAAACPDGRSYSPDRVECTAGADGLADCKGVSSTNQRWSAKIQRKAPATPETPSANTPSRPRPRP